MGRCIWWKSKQRTLNELLLARLEDTKSNGAGPGLVLVFGVLCVCVCVCVCACEQWTERATRFPSVGLLRANTGIAPRLIFANQLQLTQLQLRNLLLPHRQQFENYCSPCILDLGSFIHGLVEFLMFLNPSFSFFFNRKWCLWCVRRYQTFFVHIFRLGEKLQPQMMRLIDWANKQKTSRKEEENKWNPCARLSTKIRSTTGK